MKAGRNGSESWRVMTGIATVEAIDVQVGRTGILTPVAHISPVRLAGTVVKRVNLYNFDEVRLKDVRVGDDVLVWEAGNVIPQIVQVVNGDRADRSSPCVPPHRCPACKGPLTRPGAVHLCCTNPNCPARVKERIRHFASRGAMNIKSLGPARIERLVDSGLVRTAADLYALEIGGAAALEGMGEQSARRLLRAIEASKSRGLASLLVGLSMPHIGNTTAKALAARFGTLDALMSADGWQLREVAGVGKEGAEAIIAFFGNPRSRSVIHRLMMAGVGAPPAHHAASSHRLSALVDKITHILKAGVRFVLAAGLRGGEYDHGN